MKGKKAKMEEKMEETLNDKQCQEIGEAIASIIKDFGRLTSSVIRFMEDIDIACDKALASIDDGEVPEKEEDINGPQDIDEAEDTFDKEDFTESGNDANDETESAEI